MDIHHDNYRSPNLLSDRPSFENALGLAKHSQGGFYPMYFYSKGNGEMKIKGIAAAYHFTDPECDVVAESTSGLGGLPRHLLNLTNAPKDVRFRQEAVKEAYSNPRILRQIDDILRDNLYGENRLMDIVKNNESINYAQIRVHITPERMLRFVKQMKKLGQISSSIPLKRAGEWAEMMETDTLYQEQLREKRNVTDSRIIAAYSERYNGVKYGVLKQGVKFEDLVDILDVDVTRRLKVVEDGKKSKDVQQKIILHKYPGEQEEVEHVLVHGRQKMEVLNGITAEMLSIPAYLGLAQLQQIAVGAYLHQAMDRLSVNSVFPTITDISSEIHAKDLLPIRMILNEARRGFNGTKNRTLEGLCGNDFDFCSNDKLAQIEGANNRGKSEAWRSIHLMINLANAGFPIPAREVTYGPVSASHFISCKGREHRGGSEFEHSALEILGRLNSVHPNQNVILDELGDATNGPTGSSAAKRLVPFLLSKGCRVLVTTHNDSVGRYLEEIGAMSYVTSSEVEGKEMFRLQKKSGEAEYFPEETLDRISFTREIMEKVFNDQFKKDRTVLGIS
jgi:hypothetical protein